MEPEQAGGLVVEWARTEEQEVSVTAGPQRESLRAQLLPGLLVLLRRLLVVPVSVQSWASERERKCWGLCG